MTRTPLPAAALPGAGAAWPLGATRARGGVNFAVFSAHATGLALCLFDGDRELARLLLPGRTEDVWHGWIDDASLRGLGADPDDLVYGLRAWGPPARHGHRFNPAKLLIDPYARRFSGTHRWGEAHGDDALDSAADTMKARLLAEPAFDWGDDAPPATPLADTVLVEAHVKGLTARHPAVPTEVRGTYAGVASAPVLAHLRRVGATALCLLPVQQSISERDLVARGLVNYWGYNTIGFFAPDRRFAPAGADPVVAFKRMVRALHAAGVEVICDVVYNHSPEGDHTGPTLSLRGLDNASYYRLDPRDPERYENWSGCGNSLDMSHPRVLQLVMDSLRYWVTELRVDGLRFDLATTLGRGPYGAYSPYAAFFGALRQDPVLGRVKLIAEPWDLGPEGYQVGRFPTGWSEWNDRFRDTARAFWVRRSATRGELAARLGGSQDRFGARGPLASVNYITAHDGFTLRDLVSYDRKHNLSNGEQGRDGSDNNHSWNCGIEGPTDDPAVRALRGRLSRALLATLFLSQGVPMLLAGDELGRSQQGNNNAYCQDGPTSWIDWEGADEALIACVARLAALRRRWPQLRRRTWLRDGPSPDGPSPDGLREVQWLDLHGRELTPKAWEERGSLAFGLLLDAVGTGGGRLLVWLNGDARDHTAALPPGRWRPALDTRAPDGAPAFDEAQGALTLPAHVVLVLASSEGPPARDLRLFFSDFWPQPPGSLTSGPTGASPDRRTREIPTLTATPSQAVVPIGPTETLTLLVRKVRSCVA